MQPNQPSQPHSSAGPGPQPPYHAPEYTVDPNIPPGRHAFAANHPFQQHPSGHYEVVPPIPASPTNGGTGHNPYDFIVAANNKPKRVLFSGFGSQSFLMRIGLVLAGAVVLVIVVAVIASLLAPKSSTPGLTSVAERQQEIIRVSTAVSREVNGEDASNFTANVNISLSSCQQQVLGYLSQRKVKIPTKTLALDYDSQTDTLLANAASAGNYDTVAAQTLADQLQTYQSLLNTTYKQTSGQIARQLLRSCYASATNLLNQYRVLSGKQS